MLANGCFWSREYFYRQLPGVITTRAGFSGGHVPDPGYRLVCTKQTGHAEAVEVVFDNRRISFEVLLRHFFSHHDPSIDRRDRGGQYRSAIFYTSADQRATAQRMLDRLHRTGMQPATELQPLSAFYPAESRHQQYCSARGMSPEPKRGVPLDWWTTEKGG